MGNLKKKRQLFIILLSAFMVLLLTTSVLAENGIWSALISSASVVGVNGSSPVYVNDLLMETTGDLYAGGKFTEAGGVTVNYIAKWNGSDWSPLASGLNGMVNALAKDASGNLYVGGGFQRAKDPATEAHNIAKWNGTIWSSLTEGEVGNGVNSTVYALAVDLSNNLVYAGGIFILAGGSTANYIAKWDPAISDWSPLGDGMNSTVTSLALDGINGTTLYAGGHFTTAGGSPADYIAKWESGSWSPLGSGLNNSVNAIAVDGNTLYAGGLFTTAGTVSVNRVAKWDGTSWSPLGSGLNGGVTALFVDANHDLYVSGGFTQAGGNPATNIATATSTPGTCR